MTKAMLFDLDGTLCSMDEAFTETYLTDLGQDFLPEVVEGEFFPSIMKATFWAIQNPKLEYSCYEVCVKRFCEQYDIDYDSANKRMMNFYHQRFPQYGRMVTQFSLASTVIKAAKENGWLIALASNALMPQFAMRERVFWCGIDPDEFDFIPGIDTMHFAKPTLKYYEEIMQHLEISNFESSIMVGNSTREDMVASDLGFKTFLITHNPEDNDLSKATYHGELEDLLKFINNK